MTEQDNMVLTQNIEQEIGELREELAQSFCALGREIYELLGEHVQHINMLYERILEKRAALAHITKRQPSPDLLEPKGPE